MDITITKIAAEPKALTAKWTQLPSTTVVMPARRPFKIVFNEQFGDSKVILATVSSAVVEWLLETFVEGVDFTQKEICSKIVVSLTEKTYTLMALRWSQ